MLTPRTRPLSVTGLTEIALNVIEDWFCSSPTHSGSSTVLRIAFERGSWANCETWVPV